MRRALMAAVTVAVLALPGVAQAQDVFNSKPYRQKVTVTNMLVHERALQRFADPTAGPARRARRATPRPPTTC